MPNIFYEQFKKATTSDLPLDLTNPLDELKTEMSGCIQCLKSGKENLNKCFGYGVLSPKFMFIGEAPSVSDVNCKLFSDKVGQKLQGIIEYLSRRWGLINNIYVTSSALCPDGDASKCKQRLEEEIAIVCPTNIILLGNTPSYTILGAPVLDTRLKKHVLMLDRFYPFFSTHGLKELAYTRDAVAKLLKEELNFVLENCE